jgi:hypothetical protein
MTRAREKNSTMRRCLPIGLLLTAILYACGGSGGDSSSPSAVVPVTPPVAVLPNALTVTVDGGPAALVSSGALAANTLYATVTVCTPGSTTACTAVDHLQVDTGSTGLRVIATALGTAVPTPSTDPTSGRPLLECVQFADGFSWGSVGVADVTMAGRTMASLPIHVIGAPAAGSPPASCASGPEESDVLAFGANGVLGLGNFLQDCGQACAVRAISGTYYICPAGAPASSCTPVAVALTRQVPNPVSRLSADNNGIVVQMPAVAAPGAPTATGTVLFGIGTQANNALGNATVFGLSLSGTFSTTFNGASVPNSFIDSGSNAYFFSTAGIAVCPDAAFFYCPVTGSAVATSVTETAVINGTNARAATITFTVNNADQLFRSNNTVFPGLAGPNGTLLNGIGGAFDWGLPFFFGRNVYVLIEGSTLNGVAAPAIAF